jgi:hypothetical protein
MKNERIHRVTRLLGASIVATGLAFVACSTSTTPLAPSPAGPTAAPVVSDQTIVITPNGITPSRLSITPGYPVLIVNNDTESHRLHLDAPDESPGCGAFDDAGEVPAGERRLTGAITEEAITCLYHDHLSSHSDPRFNGMLLIDIGG